MTGRPAAERAEHLARVEAARKAEAKYAESASGMQAMAAQLRRGAGAMRDVNDRNAMIRIAADYERRADEALRRLKRFA